MLAATFCPSAAPAQASHVQCGDVITQDTTLDSDLVDCASDGVVIGADGMTLDLNGHVIDGVPFQSSNGVDDTAGYDGVTVENGSVQQFTNGVALQHADDSRVVGTHVADVFSGVRLQYSNRNRIARNSASGYAYAIELADDAQNNLVEHNVLTHSGNGVMLKPIDNPPDHPPEPPRQNRIVRNVISDTGYGVFVWDGHFNSFEGNSISSNSEYGVIVTFNSGGNTFIDNDLVDNKEGIAVFGQAQGTTLSRNHIAASAGAGLEVTSSGRGTTVVERNVSNGNGGDGFEVDTTRAVITRNTANDNGDLGIEAVAGVTDGGGNKARGNGDPRECLNVTCK